MPKNSIVQSEQSTIATQSNYAAERAAATEQSSIALQSSGSNTGIATLTFTEVQCNGDYLTDKKQAVIDALLSAAAGARALLHHDEYKPLPKPIMWTLSTLDFGVMVDAVAVSDADILARADEIMTKLSRDCDLFVAEFGGAQ